MKRPRNTEDWEKFMANAPLALKTFGLDLDGFCDFASGCAVDADGEPKFDVDLAAGYSGLTIESFCYAPSVETREALEFANRWNENVGLVWPRVTFDEEKRLFALDAFLPCVGDAVLEPAYFAEFFTWVFRPMVKKFVDDAEREFFSEAEETDAAERENGDE